jgi:NADH-quinone oxidoreductase subunit L
MHLWIIPILPLTGAAINGLLGKRFPKALVNTIALGFTAIAFLYAVWVAIQFFGLPPNQIPYIESHQTWMSSGNFTVEYGFWLDQLSLTMLLIVTGVGFVIHVFSVGYMEHEGGYYRYFAYLNLFMLSMLILVLADNLLMMFVGWEGVGLCSYLLIAFWYTTPEFAYNGRKAFITNRIGDAGFILGILTLVWALGSQGVWTLTFAGLHDHGMMLGTYATIAGLLLFVGATGKSAQIPLYVWLPDAMVGPTPVSALIHAATMVTAGVYMVVRLNFLYSLSPSAMEVIAVVAAVTSFFAATVAIVQPDIKRVLAYSTISQIGYMLLGAGVGAFASGMFHVMTHAFFKGLLFLCSGSVIHALQGEQDMNRMGGLWRKLPVTYATMLIATLAISAFPGFSGYFSKDLILESTYTSGHFWLWLLGVITAGLTSFYMFRLIFMTFHGPSRVDPEKAPHVHESPPVMTIPLIVLAILSLGGGWIGLPDGFLWGNVLVRFLEPVTGIFKPSLETSALVLSAVASACGIAGIVIAWVMYIAVPELPAAIRGATASAYRILLRKYYVDELYDRLVTRPLFWVAGSALNQGVDQSGIDGLVNGTAAEVQSLGEAVRKIETGNVQHYAFVYLLGAIAIAAGYIYLVVG